MLHITEKNTNIHSKAIIAEIFISLAMFVIFFAPLVKASDITADIIIKLVNNARKSSNVAVLKKNDILQKAAEQKAQDMIENNYFAHISPQGKSPWDWINENKYGYRYAGENLAINFTNADDQQKAWMNSPTHRKNILNENYDETGVAVKQGIIDGQRAIVVVQMFGKQMQQNISSGNMPINTVSDINNQEKKPSKVAGISDKTSLNVLFKNNQSTIIGWSLAFGFAIVLILIDIAAVIHKKHDPLFILQKSKNTKFYDVY